MKRVHTKTPILQFFFFSLLHTSFQMHSKTIFASANNSNNNCVNEFETCVMSRDCCPNLECVTGDWSVTTDSTCLSQKSQDLDALSNDERLHLIQTFYLRKDIEIKKKSKEEIEALVKKNSNTFSKLVHRLERKYKVLIDRDGGSEEL